MPFDYDLIVIGGGSGGVRCARIAAGLGAKVAVVEGRHWGGTCVNLGCIPKKFLFHAAEFGNELKTAAGMGWDGAAAHFSWPKLLEYKDLRIQRLNQIYIDILTQSSAEVIEGWASLNSAHEVLIDQKNTITAKNIVLATGNEPFIPAVDGQQWVISSDQAFSLAQYPQRVLVVGGGYIAVEFASIFHGLGSKVSLAYRGERLLKQFDHGIGPFLQSQFGLQGIQVGLNQQVQKVQKTASGLQVTLNDGVLEVDQVLYATGRRPLIERLGLEKIGIQTNALGRVLVNEKYQSSVASVYAVGDLVGRAELTPIAIKEGQWLANHLFGTPLKTVDYALVPTAVFSQPSIGTVGLTEQQAAQLENAVVYASTTRSTKQSLVQSAEQSLFKVIVDEPTDKVLGMHYVGVHAGELIQGFAAAMQAGLTKQGLNDTLSVHPTLAEEFCTLKVSKPAALA